MKDKVIIQWANGDLQAFETFAEAAEYTIFNTDLSFNPNERDIKSLVSLWRDGLTAPLCSFYSEQIRTITIKDVYKIDIRNRAVYYAPTQQDLNLILHILGASQNRDILSGAVYYLNGLEIRITKEDIVNTSWKYQDWGGHF